MRNTRILLFCYAALFAVGTALAAPPRQDAAAAPAVQVIEMSGDKYAFSPVEIHVKKGARVQLKLHSVDKEHGIKINAFAEGAKKGSPPGLRFEGKNDTGKVVKGADGTLEFVAEQPGTYRFECSIFCGLGHGRMKGKITVDE
ncbi:MAG: cupredoxin domain-containing protein [Candidatus Acidiferrum sp.]